MRLRHRLLLAVPSIVLLAACGPDAQPDPKLPVATPDASTTASVPTTPTGPPTASIDESILDKSVEPCDDFYQYACGAWLKSTPIPEDEAAWARSFSVIHEKNEATLKAILEKDAAGQGGDDPYAKQLGDYYASCTDEDGIDKRGTADLKDELAIVDGVKDLKTLVKAVARLHKLGANVWFDFDSQVDFKDATQVIGVVFQSGLGMPDRDYYIDPPAPKADAPKKGEKPAPPAKDPTKRTKKQEIREFYEGHVAAMFELSGNKPVQAKTHAKVVMRIETELARASMTNVELREPTKIYHRFDKKMLKDAAPRLDWEGYFAEMGTPEMATLNVAQPDFVKAMNDMAKSVSIADWKTYLRWHLVRRAAPSLGQKFVDQDFAYAQKLRGMKKLTPRWKRCVRAVDGAMGEALAQPFVKQTLGNPGKVAVRTMVDALEASMKANLEKLTWMDDATRTKAIEKLGKIRNKIAFPDKWRSYDGLAVDRSSYWQNRAKASAFETKRHLDKIGKPVDRDEWQMTPPTVNAYYDPTLNEIVFPAGILQPPMYGNAQTRGMNFGAIGMVIGHEITHGFDDEGRQFDAVGNLSDWWSPKVGADFDERAKCVVEQFDGYVAVDDAHVNGKLTLGENIADLGGLKIAFAAFKKVQKDSPATQNYTVSEDQQFFLGYAQSWCDNMRPEFLQTLVATNPHSPANFRVNGPLSNLPEFANAFSCKAGTKMVRANKCEVW